MFYKYLINVLRFESTEFVFKCGQAQNLRTLTEQNFSRPGIFSVV